MKRRICLLLAVLMIAVLLVPAGAYATSRDLSSQESLAYELDSLHMFEGDVPGKHIYRLSDGINLLEAVVMVIRMLGQDK